MPWAPPGRFVTSQKFERTKGKNESVMGGKRPEGQGFPGKKSSPVRLEFFVHCKKILLDIGGDFLKIRVLMEAARRRPGDDPTPPPT
jgi:hypothetical protein